MTEGAASSHALAAAFLLLALLTGCAAEPSPDEEVRDEAASAVPPLERLPDGAAGELVRRGIEAHGGWEAWTALPAVDYRKTTVRFDEDGTVADSVVEQHRYALHPGPRMRIDWTDEGGRRVTLMNDGDEAWRFVDGVETPDPDAPHQAWNSTFGSHYVFSQPFKLTDSGTNLEFLGPETLPDGTAVEALRVTYDPGAGSAGGMHTWVYYFDAASGLLAGYRFGEGDAVDSRALTTYSDFREVAGVKLYRRRTAHALEDDGSLRTTVVYRHEGHDTSPRPDSIFVHPDRRGR